MFFFVIEAFGTNAQPASGGCSTQRVWDYPNKHFATQWRLYIRTPCLRRRYSRQLLRQKFSDHFNFARISSALTPLANSFFSTSSASAFFADSAALVSALTFLASILAISLSIDFSSAFLVFRSAFSASIFAVMDAISAAAASFAACFSAICAAKSTVAFAVLGLFLLPLGRGIGDTSIQYL